MARTLVRIQGSGRSSRRRTAIWRCAGDAPGHERARGRRRSARSTSAGTARASRRSRGEHIELPARVVHVAWRAEVHRGLGGCRRRSRSCSSARRRAGSRSSPASSLRTRRELLASAWRRRRCWDEFLAAEPRAVRRIDAGARRRGGARRSRTTSTSSRRSRWGTRRAWRALRQAAARRAGCRRGASALRIAALLHDLGRVSVPNGIWDKPGPLNAAEWERVRLHAIRRERILARRRCWRRYAADRRAASRAAATAAATTAAWPAARVATARCLRGCGCYHAMTEERPHRPALRAASAAARLLADEARGGRLDREAVEAVLAAAGHGARTRVRGELPAQLSEREVEVLCLLARGLSNKEIARRSCSSRRARCSTTWSTSTTRPASDARRRRGLCRGARARKIGNPAHGPRTAA